MGTQESAYPITVIPPGQRVRSRFPPGYQTPWDKIEIMVTEKMSPNLFVLHGSEGLDPAHPDASGGRAMALFGPDGVLMVDTQNRQVAEKTLKALRSFTDGADQDPGQHARSQRPHRRQRLLRQAGRADLRAGEPAQRDAASAAARQRPAGAGARHGRRSGRRPTATTPPTPGQPAVTFNMNGETVDFIPMMPSHTAGDTIVRFRKANVIYIEDFYRNFGYPFADQANGGSIKGMLEAVDLIAEAGRPRHDAHPRPWHAGQEEGSAAVSRHAGGHHGQGENAARSGQVAEGSAGREPDRAVRQDDAGRHAAEQGSLHHRGRTTK